MKRLLLFLVFLSFCFSNVLAAQTFEDGISSYNKANIAKMTDGGKERAKKEFKKAYQIFKALASEKNPQALVMYYFLALKQGEAFSGQQLLAQYLKKEHPDYPTIKGLNIMDGDKKFILDKIRKLANQNRERAAKLLKEAEKNAANDQYGEALDKLLEAEKTWDIEGIAGRKNKYERLKKKRKTERLIKRVKELTNQGLYQEALTAVNGGKELLESSQIASLNGEIKHNWYNKLLNEAKVEYKNKNYSQAITKCDEAYSILPSDEALKLKRKSQKKIKSGKPRGGALFADLGFNGVIKPNDMNYHWNGNSFPDLDISDRTTITAEAINEKGETLKVGYTIQGGLMVLFSPSVGIFASAAYSKQDLNIISDYSFTLTYEGDTFTADQRYFTDTGNISVIPISLDLVVLLKLGEVGTFSLYAGPTLFLTNVDMKTRIGYAGFWRRSNGDYKFDWFPLEYQVKKNESVFGGNVGADLEFKTGKSAAFYLGFQYYFAPAKESDWILIEKRYDGEFGYFYTTDPAHELGPMPDYKTKINLSTYKIHLGLKVYF